MNLSRDSRVLEVGCGTGAITAALGEETPAALYGVDINLAYLRLARANDTRAAFSGGNALALPFAADRFDAVVCHFLLLWLDEPGQALAEMRRVVRPGGFVAAFAEPDYGGRVDYPPPLDELGRLQAEALRLQGAEVQRGRELSALFHAAGLQEIETGVLGGQWRANPELPAIDAEWATLESDLTGTVSPERLAALRQADLSAWQAGSRVLFVPTFYAIGRK